MISLDTDYLHRIADIPPFQPMDLLKEPAFAAAQDLFFEVLARSGGSVDFQIADMREVHIAAALPEDLHGISMLDVGCGSPENYVLGDNFRDRYPPFLAEMLSPRGANVTGIDIRPNTNASYDHRTLDLIDCSWTQSVDEFYDLVSCLAVFNAPSSPFEHSQQTCDQLMRDMRSVIKADGIFIATLPEFLYTNSTSIDVWRNGAEEYLLQFDFRLMQFGRSLAWARPV